MYLFDEKHLLNEENFEEYLVPFVGGVYLFQIWKEMNEGCFLKFLDELINFFIEDEKGKLKNPLKLFLNIYWTVYNIYNILILNYLIKITLGIFS